MLINLDIIKATEDYCKQAHLSAERRHYVAQLADDYREACTMSTIATKNQAAKERVEHWEKRAKKARAALCLAIGYCHDHCEATL